MTIPFCPVVSLSLIHIFKGLVHEFYERNLRPLLVRSAANPSTCAAITSALAGDVYRPAMWQGLFREGFSVRATESLGTNGSSTEG